MRDSGRNAIASGGTGSRIISEMVMKAIDRETATRVGINVTINIEAWTMTIIINPMLATAITIDIRTRSMKSMPKIPKNANRDRHEWVVMLEKVRDIKMESTHHHHHHHHQYRKSFASW